MVIAADLPPAVGWVLAGLTVAAVFGLVIGYAWVNLKKAGAEAYKANNDELERRVELLEDHVKRCESELEAMRNTNVQVLAAGVAQAIQGELVPIMTEIREELAGQAAAMDSMAEGLGHALSWRRRGDAPGA